MKKLLIKLIAVFLISGCASVSQPKSEILKPEQESIESSTIIKYNTTEDFEGERSLIVNNITLKAGDKYYTFTVNGPVNYSSSDNYFFTGETFVSLIDQPQGCGLYSNDDETEFEAIQQIDENAYVRAKGSDLDHIKDILSNVYVSDGITYQMFDHNIAEEWTKEVIITDDVVSLSNGEDTVYIYHNEGSSDGPTIFYKQLDNIDIPITYPEEGFGFNYIPYGFTEYDHLIVDGYTPYSAYDFGKVELVLQEKTPLSQMDTYKKEATEYGSAFIILAKDDETLYSLFEEETDNSSISALSVDFSNEKLMSTDPEQKEKYDLSNVKNIAQDVINSDNRYHTQLLLEDGKDVTVTFTSEKTGKTISYVEGLYNDLTRTEIEVDGDYYLDGQEGYIAPPQNFYITDQWDRGYKNPGMPGEVTEIIYGGMDSKLIIPTLKLIRPTYRDVTSTMTGGSYRPYNFGASLEEQLVSVTFNEDTKYNYVSTEIGGHGCHQDRDLYLKYKGFNWYTDFGVREAISIGDYVYLRKEKELYIYQCERNEPAAWANSFIDEYLRRLRDQDLFYDLYTRSCYVEDVVINNELARNPAIMNAYNLISVVNLNQ